MLTHLHLCVVDATDCEFWGRGPICRCRMVLGMNSAKAKGDRGEREAVAMLCQLAPDLVLPNARRKLGAGRRDDIGDLEVFPDVTIQVKTMANVVTALRDAALGAEEQAARARTTYQVGIAPIPRSRKTAVRWLAATTAWPEGPPPDDEVRVVGRTQDAIIHCRSEHLGIPRFRRIANVRRAGAAPLYISTIEAWVFAWQHEVSAQSTLPVAAWS